MSRDRAPVWRVELHKTSQRLSSLIYYLIGAVFLLDAVLNLAERGPGAPVSVFAFGGYSYSNSASTTAIFAVFLIVETWREGKFALPLVILAGAIFDAVTSLGTVWSPYPLALYGLWVALIGASWSLTRPRFDPRNWSTLIFLVVLWRVWSPSGWIPEPLFDHYLGLQLAELAWIWSFVHSFKMRDRDRGDVSQHAEDPEEGFPSLRDQ